MNNNERKCPSCKGKNAIVDSRDKHWDERLLCAECCASAHNCSECQKSWESWLRG